MTHRATRWLRVAALATLLASCGQTEQAAPAPPAEAPPAPTCPIPTCSSSRGMPRGSWKLQNACAEQLDTPSQPKLGGALNIDGPSTFWQGTTLVIIDERALLFWDDGQLWEGRYCEDGDSLVVSAPGLELEFARAVCVVGERRCDGNRVLECSHDAELVPVAQCSDDQACDQDMCVPRCEPRTLFCEPGGERRCNDDGLRRGLERGARCADGVACVEGSGCQGARSLALGHVGGGSLCNVGFAGQLIQATASATLVQYDLAFTTYGLRATLDWQVYEARYPTGPFGLVWSEAATVGAGDERPAPKPSLPLLEGRYYLLGVSAPANAIFMGGLLDEETIYAKPVGVIHLPASPAGEPFNVQALADAPPSLVCSALIEP